VFYDHVEQDFRFQRSRLHLISQKIHSKGFEVFFVGREKLKRDQKDFSTKAKDDEFDKILEKSVALKIKVSDTVDTTL
jgi:hypothetical protein